MLSGISFPYIIKALFIAVAKTFWESPLVKWYTDSILSWFVKLPNLISEAFITFLEESNFPITIILSPMGKFCFKNALPNIDTPTIPFAVERRKLSLFVPPLNLITKGILSTLPSTTIFCSGSVTLFKSVLLKTSYL